MADAGVSYGAPDPAKSYVCGSVCFWPDDATHLCGRRSRKKDQRSPPPNAGVERVATRSSSRLHQLAAVRGEPEDDSGERAHAKTGITQIGTWWAGSSDWAGEMRALRAHDAGILRHAIGPRAPVPVSRR